MPSNLDRFTDNEDFTKIKAGHDVANNFARAQAKGQSEGESAGDASQIAVAQFIG